MEANSKLENELEINLTELFWGLIDHIWIIIFSGLLAGSILFGAAYLMMEPEYKSSVVLYANNMTNNTDVSNLSYQDLSASILIANTCAEIIQSDIVVNEVIDKSGLDYKKADLLKMINISAVNNTEMIKIEVKETSALEAALLANTFAEISAEKLVEIVEGSSVKILNSAEIPELPEGPSYLKLLILGILLGSALAVAVILLKLIFDVRIKSERDLEQFGCPIIGIVPDMSNVRHGGYYRR